MLLAQDFCSRDVLMVRIIARLLWHTWSRQGKLSTDLQRILACCQDEKVTYSLDCLAVQPAPVDAPSPV